jgi:thiol-disulfide isomerase/thioredoxin
MKYIIGLAAMLLPILSGAQSPPVKALSVGDTVRDISLSPIINYPIASVNLLQFKNKLVLLDFMTSGCISCLEALPRLDSLQQKYKDQLQIFLITPESIKRVHSFLNRKYMANISLPVIADDTTLSQIFPHTFISHDVLIKNQQVVAITFPEYIVDKNINSVLSNQKVNFPVKKDITLFQYGEPILHLNEKVIPDLSYPASVFYSGVTGYLNNVPAKYSVVKDSAENIFRISMINFPVIQLYLRTFSLVRLAPAFIIINGNKSRFAYDKEDGFYNQWLAQNTYCYEGAFPLNMPDSIIKIKIRNDLDFYLGLRVKMVKKNVVCWVIQKLPGGIIENNDLIDNGDPASNASVDDIIYLLNKKFGNTPVLDESGENERKMAGLKWDQCTDITFLKKTLPRYGLQIHLMTRSVDLLQIEEAPTTNFNH